jgi:hypothetical protein
VGARKELAPRSIRSKFAELRRAKRHGDPIPAALWDEVEGVNDEPADGYLNIGYQCIKSDIATGPTAASAVRPTLV